MRQAPTNDTRTCTVTDPSYYTTTVTSGTTNSNITVVPGYDIPYVITTDSTEPSYWRALSTSDVEFSDETYQKILQKVMSEFSKRPVIEHKCRNCGAVLEMDANKPIFICKYCGTTYAVGTNMINDRGD